MNRHFMWQRLNLMTCFCSLNPHPKSFLENERCLYEFPTLLRTLHSESFIDFFYSMFAILPAPHKPSKANLMRSPKQVADVMFLKTLFVPDFSPGRALLLQPQGDQRNENSAKAASTDFPSLFICFFICTSSKKRFQVEFLIKDNHQNIQMRKKCLQCRQNQGNRYQGCLGLLQQKRLPEGGAVRHLWLEEAGVSRTGAVGFTLRPHFNCNFIPLQCFLVSKLFFC